jgi:hypothetical protein
MYLVNAYAYQDGREKLTEFMLDNGNIQGLSYLLRSIPEAILRNPG